MTGQQLLVFIILGVTLIMFAWNRWRYDVVSIMALLAVALTGLVEPENVFSGFAHPAVITVAAVLVLSRGLLNAGVVDSIARLIGRAGNRPAVQVALLTAFVALCSAFMNNVGALALLMPVSIWISRRAGFSPAIVLMPLAFGSLLGGTVTLIGTPPNIIIASYRLQTAAAEPFGMFDFLPVGIGVTLTGMAFISLVGWRLVPKRLEASAAEELFKISDYLTEVSVPESSKYAGRTLHDLFSTVRKEADVQLVALIRDKERKRFPSFYTILQPGDILQIEADSDDLKKVLDDTGFELAESVEQEDAEARASGELNALEAVVTPDSPMVGQTAAGLNLRQTHRINLLAVARQGQRIRDRLGDVRFLAGDIILVEGNEGKLVAALNDLGCLPLAERGLRLGKPRKTFQATLIFAVALGLITFGIVPAATALVCAALVMVMVGLLSSREAYQSIDLPVIILLAAMIPVGQVLESSGGATLIAAKLLRLSDALPPAMTLAVLIGATMLLSNLVNNAAAAILVAPIAIKLAQGMQVCADPLLMAVAIGCSCAFLTPVGHQSNALVMAPGGYRFGDYWRMGLPLSLVVIAVAVPLILLFWPF